MIPFVENEEGALWLLRLPVICPARGCGYRFFDSGSQRAGGPQTLPRHRKPVKPEKQLQITVAVVPAMVVNRYKEICKAAGLKLGALGFQSDARAESLRYCGVVPKDFLETLMLLSVTGDTVILDVIKGENLVFSREASLKEFVLNRKDKKQEEERVEQITTETVRCLHSYEQEDLQGQISMIYVMNMGESSGVDRSEREPGRFALRLKNLTRQLQLKIKRSRYPLAHFNGRAGSGDFEKDRLSIDFES